MKFTKSFFALLATVLMANIASEQDEGPVSEMYLKGKWTATCATEVLDKANIRSCEICPFVIAPDNKRSTEIKDIEMTFHADSITITQNGKVTTVPYTRNKDSHAISFTLNNKQYNFRMFFYNKQRILEDSDGLLVVLEKTK
ncbi:MAG TPA: hypothetical protein PKC85_03345 [Bacteroidia bacterium]|jgi:hypothetical protein|nr:hypothetical protein [Bacteroidia bacterium]HMU18859.1 hypothetical protein [Bacteroidia bacterium]